MCIRDRSITARKRALSIGNTGPGSRMRSAGTTDTVLLAPHRHRSGTLHHRPLVLVDVHQRVAGGRLLPPACAEALLRQLPRPLAFLPGLVLRLTRHLAVGGERLSL